MLIRFLNEQTISIMALCVIGGMVLLSLGLTWLVIRFSGKRLLHVYAGLITNLGAPIIAGFVLFVALVINGVLHDTSVAEQSVDQEAHALHLALSVLDKQQYPLLHQAIANYIDKVVKDEWQEMRAGVRGHGAHDALQNLRSLATNGLPGLSSESRKVLLDSVAMIDSARQSRLFTAADEVPLAIWAALWVTVVVSIFFSAAAHAGQPSSAYLMATLYGISIGAMFFAIVIIDHPFLGPTAITAQPIASLRAGL